MIRLPEKTHPFGKAFVKQVRENKRHRNEISSRFKLELPNLSITGTNSVNFLPEVTLLGSFFQWWIDCQLRNPIKWTWKKWKGRFVEEQGLWAMKRIGFIVEV